MMETATLRPRSRLAIWLAVFAGLALLGAANWHLVHVAMTSQPDCVSHLRLGQRDAQRGVYSAAKSSCSP